MPRHPAFVALFLPFALAGMRADAAEPRLTLDGYGPIRIGMTPSQLERAGVRYETPDNIFGGIQECAHAAVVGRPGLTLMFENGRVSRIEVDRPGILTRSGAQVGDSEAKVKRLYGARLEVAPEGHDNAGHVFVVSVAGNASYLVMDTDGEVVTGMRAGPSAGYVEGCA